MTDKEIELQAKIDWLQRENEEKDKKNAGYETIIKDLTEVCDRHEAYTRELEKEVAHWMKEKDKAEKMLLHVRESIGKYFRKELPASYGKYQSGNPKLSGGASDWYPKDQRI